MIANKGYEITSEQDWLGVDKPTGHGLNDVLIVAKENESGALRTGTLLVRSGNLYEELVVTQTEQAPDPMRLFYHQDFEWCIPLANLIPIRWEIRIRAEKNDRMYLPTQ